ncbi:hypothetical protein BHE74_00023697 [Ensete ventricosum]|nr:hypothetical protein BHE74_00023697 [Ensete ventricosum]
MIGFEWTVAKFFWYIFFMYFTLLYFTFYGMMTVGITPNHNIAAIVSAAFYGLWNLFSGFIVPRPCRPAALVARISANSWGMHSSRRLRAALRTEAKTHARLLKSGDAAVDPCTWNKVLASYSKSGGLAEACKLFDEIPLRDTVSWNSLIAAHVLSQAHRRAWSVFRTMLSEGLSLDQHTFGSVLKSVGGAARLDLGGQVHALIVKSSFDRNVFSGSALVDMYAKCGRIREAVMALELMPEPNVVSWNAVVAGYARAGDAEAAFRVSCRMEREGVMLDEATFASLLTLLHGTADYGLMSQAHAKIVKCGRTADTIVCNAAITAYSQCGSVADSRKIFDRLDGVKDLVTWNSMLAAYACHGLTAAAIELFARMQKLGIDPDVYTFTSAISACFDHGQGGNGRALHAVAVKMGYDDALPVCNALIAMYMRPGEDGAVDDAWRCFRSMELKDSVSWNSMLTGLSQNGSGEAAAKLFAHMLSGHVEIDQYSFCATLRSCADLAVLQLGRQIHGLALRSGFAANEFVGSSLIHMYSKCGVLEDARQVFDETPHGSSSVTWNSMIFGLAQHGRGRTALDLFTEMREREVSPDHITFVGLITACSHTGLVEEGSRLLKLMQPAFGVPLRMEHYACGVDLFGRAGRLDEAKKLVESMPFEPDAMVWMTLLGGCRIHGDMALAGHVTQHLRLSEEAEHHHSTYVLLSHMYSGLGLWADRAMVQKAMRSRGLSKVPGWSWMEITNEVHSFNAEDRSHPQSEEIYRMLELLIEVMEMAPFSEIEVLDSIDPSCGF